MPKQKVQIRRIDADVTQEVRDKFEEICERLGFNKKETSKCISYIITTYSEAEEKARQQLAAKVKYKLYEILEMLGEA